ncbi:MAG: hypothetical protein WCJ75_04505 [Desulfomonile sp.]|jgi:hypothetical protein
MASIADLCWANSQDLLREVDLHVLYVLQFKAIGAAHYRNYPYHLLVHTGKITIGINLGQESDVLHGQTFFQKRNKGTFYNLFSDYSSLKEPLD